MEEFPRWLEKVSTKISGGVTVVIDGLDNRLVASYNVKIGKAAKLFNAM